MRRALHILFFLILCIPAGAQQPLVPEVPFETGAGQSDLDSITARLVRRIADRPAVWADAVRYAQTPNPEGEWPDVDYSLDAARFPVMPHLRRMVLLARAYTDLRSPLCGEPAVKECLMAAFDRYRTWYAAGPRIDNWWFRDIGAPQEYATVLLLLKPALEREDLLRLAEYVPDGTVHWPHRGKNRTWVSIISLMKACTLDDVSLAERAITSVASTAEYALRQGDEGFKFDMSIHQHRPQAYSGGYGMSLVGDLADFIRLTRGTAFGALFTPEKCELLARALLDGTRLFGYRGAVDFGVIGRGISRPGNSRNIDPAVLELMAGNDSLHTREFRAWRDHVVDSACFPAPGNKHFWCSDMMTHHGANYYLSVKIPSTRTVGTEQLNRENLKGFNLPLGATNILTHGREYFDVFPLWDWTKVPGVTALSCEDSTRLQGYLFGKNEFGGGVSDGRNGVMAFEYDYRGLKARKSYFLIGDRMLCLGCDITSAAPHRVTTTLNQCFLRGDVCVWKEGVERISSAENSETIASPSRLWHDGVAYLIPSGDIRLETKACRGVWSDLAEEIALSPTQPVSDSLFTLWLDHGTNPTKGEYCYVVVPDVSRDAVAGLPADGGFEVVTNTPELQLVHNEAAGVSAVVFYRPGKAVLPDGTSLVSDRRILLLVTRCGDGFTICYSDPLYYQREATLTVNRVLSGPNTEVHDGVTTVRLQFPQYPDLGRTTTLRFTPQADVDTVARRLTEEFMARDLDVEAAGDLIASLDDTGHWPDIDYSPRAKGFPVIGHLGRLNVLTQACVHPNSPWRHDAGLLKKTTAAFDAYLTYYTSDPVIENWWYVDIGAPQKYMTALLPLKGLIARERLLSLSAYLQDRTGNRVHRGKNRTWVSAVTIYKGCIEENYELVSTGFRSIASTMEIAPRQGDEGLKVDGSIHQHRPQIYSGGYGMSLLSDMAEYIRLAHGTGFEADFPPERRALLTRTLLDGTRMLGYRRGFDFGTVGRNISRPGGPDNFSPEQIDRVVEIDPAHAPELQAWRAHVADSAPFPAPGNKYFWCSDMMTHHGADYYLSVKIPSARTVGTEQLNRENLKGFNLPLGATNILTTGEEYRSIFPLWDWTKIPGVTAVQSPDSARLEGYLFGKNEFGGGVSDGNNGVMAFEYDYRGLRARKGYFLFGDRMLCLGNSIGSDAASPIATAVNQCHLNGPVTVKGGDGCWRSVPPGGCDTLSGCIRVWHSDVEYLFPQAERVILSTRVQEGRWSDINGLDNHTESLSGAIFNLWLDHGTRPADATYCYVVTPRAAAGALAEEECFEVLENTAERMVVRSQADGLTAVVFFCPGTASLGEGVELHSDKKALVLLEEYPGGVHISCADPLHYQQRVVLTLNIPLRGPGAVVCDEKTTLKIEFPQFPDSGRPKKIKLDK